METYFVEVSKQIFCVMTKPHCLETLASAKKIQYIPFKYEPNDSQASALRLVLTLRPDWKDDKIDFIRFTDGITNTLLKVVRKLSGLSVYEIDEEAILLRAYGPGTELIIDREQEAQNHEMLMRYNLAPELLARFKNGMLYRFIQGSIPSPAELRKQEIWHAVARRLAEWHAVVPCTKEATGKSSHETYCCEHTTSISSSGLIPKATVSQAGNPEPNLWTVLQKWVYALPTETLEEKERQKILQREIDRLIPEFINRPGLGNNSLVFAHCDLLCGNIIILPQSNLNANATLTVSFIDYEYATPSPAAFDIANHFAEWGGFDCDYHQLPTQSQRLDFIREYICSYYKHLQSQISPEDQEIESKRLFSEVDFFRGLPGLYWGIWSLIQTKISKIDFDYASYAEVRLAEYWAWRAETDGTRAVSGKQMPLREARWAQEF